MSPACRISLTLIGWLAALVCAAPASAHQLLDPVRITTPRVALATTDSTSPARYPDLRTLPPRDVRLDRADVSVLGTGDMHNVLRFSNTVWNAGEGQLRIRGQIDPVTKSGPATQRVFNDDGTYNDYPAGSFYYHPEHQHYHYVDWGRYELWTKAGYDKWITDGRPTRAPDVVGTKTTSCVLDEEFIQDTGRTPWPGVFGADRCMPDQFGLIDEGLSPGYGDTYDYYRYEQWIDLGQSTLSDGDYVLRSVTDPTNKVLESPAGTDVSREGQEANEAIQVVRISGGRIVDVDRPSGSVSINGTDASTAATNVTVRIVGRDDVSGVNQVRVSNDGVTWATYNYTGNGSTPMVVNWDLADARYGGTTAAGTRTVYVQTHDASGKWSPTLTDAITLGTGTGGGGTGGSTDAYETAIRSDNPRDWWRLAETSGTAAADVLGRLPGTYVNNPVLGATGLLASDPSNRAVSFTGSNYVRIQDLQDALAPGTSFSIEAWIKPTSIPPVGGWASIITRPESWSLQFNGPRLEFTVIQSGVRRRAQAPVDAVVPGQTYHVVGTYDGQMQRLYLNGALAASMTQTGAASAGANGVYLGSWDGNGEHFSGTIDEPAVYDGVLTGLQVKNHYDAGISAPVGVRAPSGLTAKAASASRIDLSWTDNSVNETGFEIQRSRDSTFSSTTTFTAPAGATTISDTGLSDSTTYYYRVRALTDTDQSAWSGTASATTQAVQVAAPSGLSASATSTSAISLRWTDNAGNETGYELQRARDASFTSPATISLAAGATSYADTGLTAGTAYYYRVRAVAGSSTSAWSGGATATTQASTTPPTSYAAAVGADAPVSWWRLGDTGTTLTDARSANPGSYLNGVLLGQPSLLGTDVANLSATFDGVNDWGRVPSASSLQLTSGITLEAWIKPARIPTTGGWATVVSKPESYALQFNGPRLEFTLMQSGVRQRLQAASGAVVAGQRYHVVGTYDGATQRLYINGVQVASRAQTGPASTNTNPIGVGSWNGLGEFLGGTIDEAAVYAKPLSAAQIKTHYDAGA